VGSPPPPALGYRGSVGAVKLIGVTITITSASVDDLGRLMHAEDAAAQTCLAFQRLEAELDRRGLRLDALRRIELCTVADAASVELVDLVRERLGERLRGRGPTVRTGTATADRLRLPGMLVELRAEVTVAD